MGAAYPGPAAPKPQLADPAEATSTTRGSLALKLAIGGDVYIVSFRFCIRGVLGSIRRKRNHVVE
jgi:hypothetical protein